MSYLDIFIKYSDNHSGAVMAFLTLVYVLASILMAYAMFRANRLSNYSILESKQLEMERKRPFVIFDIEIHNNVFFYVVKNIGLTPAKSIKISVSPEPKHKTTPFPAFLKNKISFLAPGRSLESMLDTTASFLRKNIDITLDVKLEYEDVLRNLYSESIPISFKEISNIVPVQNQKTQYDKISEEIKGIKDEIIALNEILVTMRGDLLKNKEYGDRS